MSGVQQTCPLCGAHGRARPVPAFRSQHLVRCRECGFHYCGRVPSKAELDAYYVSYPIKPPHPITINRYHELLDGFEAEKKLGAILDVGCGGGDFLTVAKERGWQVHGTEYDDGFVAHCRARGIAMQQGALEAIAFGAQRFDVVTSFEVLEHLSDPAAMVRQAVDLLRPGGSLYLTTPNYNSLSRYLAGSGWDIVNYPEHLSLFTPRTIHRLFWNEGLQREQLRTTGISITRIRTSHKSDGRTAPLPSTDDEALRGRLERSPLLGLVKRLVNRMLSITGKGDTLKALYRKPG